MNGLSFYKPEFLWALLFAAGVLLVHLLRRPRARAIDFSTLRFFREHAVAATRMRRLRSLLLLFARLGAVTLLVAVFAQLFDKKDRLSVLRDPHLTLFVWIDRTPSMEYATGGASIVERARALVDSLKKHIPSTARCLWYDEARDEFVPWDTAVSPRVRHGPPRLEEAMRTWNEDGASFSMPFLMLCSDFQRATTDVLDTLLRRAPPRSSMACVTLAPASPRNFFVRNARLQEAESASRLSLSVGARGGNLDSGELTITMGGISAGRTRVSVQANGTAEADINVAGGLKSPGGCVTLTAKDPLLFDNTVFFTPRSRSARRVIVVGDRERDFPIAAAFLAAGASRWHPVTVKESDQVEFDELDSADVIVLGHAEKPSRQLDAFLSGRSSTEKIVVCALDAGDEGFGRSAMFVSSINRSSRPLTLAKRDTPAAIVLPDTLSALWRGFPELRTREAAVYRYAEGLPGVALLRLDNGVPLVTRISDGRGRIWIFVGTPLGVTGANNICETGFFVPFVDRLVRYGGGEISAAPDTWIAGFECRNPMYGSGKGASVFSEEGKLFERWLSQPLVLFREPGIYRIAPDDGEAYWITVHPDPAESELVYAKPSVPGKESDTIVILNEMQLKEAFRGRGRFLSYVPWVALVLLLFAEILLWERNPRSRPGSGT